MAEKKLHEVLVEILHTDTAIFLASGPSVSETAERLDGLAEVQVALDEVRGTVRRRFIGLLEEAERARSEPDRSPVSAGGYGAREHHEDGSGGRLRGRGTPT